MHCGCLLQGLEQCVKNQYVRRTADARRFCHEGCAEHTRCGPVIVPEDHLQ
ncbi:unnamed protein product, partial [Ranitomeya imitator]